MIVRHQKRPVAYTDRQQLRQDALPDLYSFTRPPSLAETTKTEITDEMIGLAPNPVAQIRAEEAIRSALAFRHRQAEQTASRRRPVTPVAVRIALAADDHENDLTMPDVVEALVPARVRFDE